MLADTHTPVLLFETGLPTRYYIDPTDVAFEHLEASSTQTLCPYKGVTSGYWSVHVGDTVHPDLDARLLPGYDFIADAEIARTHAP